MSKTIHERIKIVTENGIIVDAIAPIIISASRATDIPAFYASWFAKRLEAGYVTWKNPFNGISGYISFQKTRLVVFWSKNPEPILPYLDKLNNKNLNCIFHFTLNDYEKEGLEPNVPKLSERIRIFKELSCIVGKDKLLWRFDPLLLSDGMSVEKLLEKIRNIGDEINKFTSRLTISFLTFYKKVIRNLSAAGFNIRPLDLNEVYIIAEKLKKMCNEWGIDVMTCAEEIDLQRFGVDHGSCIDAMHLGKIFSHDHELMNFLGLDNPELFNEFSVQRRKLKDKGQRKFCNCILSKDIGKYDTCPHLCIYCYANSSPERVLKNYREKRSWEDWPDAYC